MSAFESINFELPGGAKLKAMLEARLQSLRESLDSEHMGQNETLITRGKIAEVKRMLQVAPPRLEVARYGNLRGGDEQ